MEHHHYHRPKKSMGQNFLIDQHIISRIIEAADLKPSDHLLEIGPGQGALTRLVHQKVENLVAVELDRDLIHLLNAAFTEDDHVEITHADILKLDLEHLLLSRYPGTWKVVANLPYNISSQVLFKLLDFRHLFSTLILMFQREVGERLIALPGGKSYGVLSLLVPLHFDIHRVTIVKPGAFYPVPKVDSVVLRFDARPNPLVDVGDEKIFRAVVKGAFAHRRKTLFNSLKSCSVLPEPDIRRLLEWCAIDGGRRGETLTMDEFASLSRTASILLTGEKLQ